MKNITEKQKTEFYQGFVSAMLWSTGGEPDYSEAPAGYSICEDENGYWAFCLLDGNHLPEYNQDSKRRAIMVAWAHSGAVRPQLEDLNDFELAPETATALRAHCDKWVDDNAALLAVYAEDRHNADGHGSTGWELAGHDFWMTSASHGVGFWDRGLGTLGVHLTEACEQFEYKHDVYIGDDGLVYVSGLETPVEPHTVTLTAQQRERPGTTAAAELEKIITKGAVS